MSHSVCGTILCEVARSSPLKKRNGAFGGGSADKLHFSMQAVIKEILVACPELGNHLVRKCDN
jgi:hypothetical protein